MVSGDEVSVPKRLLGIEISMKTVSVIIEFSMTFEYIWGSIRYRTAFLHRNFDQKTLGILAKIEAKKPFQSLIFDEKPLGLSSNFLIIFEHLESLTAGPRRRNFDEKPLGKPPN